MILLHGNVYIPVVQIERVWCKDSIVLIYTIETGQRAVCLIPYN